MAASTFAERTYNLFLMNVLNVDKHKTGEGNNSFRHHVKIVTSNAPSCSDSQCRKRECQHETKIRYQSKLLQAYLRKQTELKDHIDVLEHEKEEIRALLMMEDK